MGKSLLKTCVVDPVPNVEMEVAYKCPCAVFRV